MADRPKKVQHSKQLAFSKLVATKSTKGTEHPKRAASPFVFKDGNKDPKPAVSAHENKRFFCGS